MTTTNYHFWRGNLIRLRAIEQKDLDAAAQSFEEMDTEAERYESEIPFPFSREQDRAGLEKLRQREPGDDSFFWIIENLEGEVVGYINTFDCERRPRTFKYALAIRCAHRRRGYAREAITIVLRYFFRELGYQKLTSMVYCFNEPSIRMHEKLGFVFEGRIRRMVYTNGRHYDTIYFGMTREEFDQLDPPEKMWEDTHYQLSSLGST
jgi:RimJ/RimL family protein N-acetyltransferase